MPLNFIVREGDYAWTARTSIASWAGWRDRSVPYASALDSEIDIIFAPEGRDQSPLLAHELAMIEWLLANEARLSDAVKDAVFTAYPQLRDEHGYDEEELAEFMPVLPARDDLKRLIGLNAIHIHQIAKDGIPYVGFELECSWDREHGVGLMMHDTRVVDLGGADSAILLWIAKQDMEGG